MFGQGGGPFGAEAVQKETFGGGRKVPRAFEQDGGKKPFVPYRKGKKPMRFGNAPKAEGLDFGSIMERK